MSDQTAEPVPADPDELVVDPQVIVDDMAGRIGRMSIELAMATATNQALTKRLSEATAALAELEAALVAAAAEKARP